MDIVDNLIFRDRSIINALTSLGIGEGSIVYTATDLSRIAFPKFTADELELLPRSERNTIWLEWLFRSVREVIGTSGTHIVPTFSYNYARHNTPYIHVVCGGPLPQRTRAGIPAAE